MEPEGRLVLLLGIGGLLLVACLKFLLPLAAPFLVGLVLSCLIEPMVSLCERTGWMPRWLAAGLVLAAVLILASVFLMLIGVSLWHELRSLAGAASEGGELYRAIESLLKAAEVFLARLPAAMRRTVLEAARMLPARLADLIRSLFGGLGQLPQWLFFLFLGVLTAYFFSRDRGIFGRLLLSLTPREWRGRALDMKDQALQTLTGFVRVQMLLIFITAAIGTIGLALLGVPRAFLLGAVLGLLDFLPAIGPGALLLPWAGVHLALGGWAKGCGLILLFLFLAAGREIAEMRLVGRNFGLHPLAVLAAIYIGSRLFGLAGIIIGPTVLVIMRALYGALRLPGDASSSSFQLGKERS